MTKGAFEESYSPQQWPEICSRRVRSNEDLALACSSQAGLFSLRNRSWAGAGAQGTFAAFCNCAIHAIGALRLRDQNRSTIRLSCAFPFLRRESREIPASCAQFPFHQFRVGLAGLDKPFGKRA